ncbi:hypothetical protein [Comamonas sp. MYb69]|uniref:hypothetical protein n=1 Tax=Comamonas sp. MYb69 TaxID=1848650 RepID=UPI0030A2912C
MMEAQGFAIAKAMGVMARQGCRLVDIGARKAPVCARSPSAVTPAQPWLLEVVPPQGILGASEKGQGFGWLVQIGLHNIGLLGGRIALAGKQAFLYFSKGSGAHAGHLQKLFRVALGYLFNGGNAISCEHSPQMRRKQALQGSSRMERWVCSAGIHLSPSNKVELKLSSRLHAEVKGC